MNAVAAADPEAIPREDLMTLRHHFQSPLDAVRREGRYRSFTDLAGIRLERPIRYSLSLIEN
jgi:hypothetical protein